MANDSVRQLVDPDPISTGLRQLLLPSFNFVRDELQRLPIKLGDYNSTMSITVKLEAASIYQHVDLLAASVRRCVDAGAVIGAAYWSLTSATPTFDMYGQIGVVMQYDKPRASLIRMTWGSGVDLFEFNSLLDLEDAHAMYLRDIYLDAVSRDYNDLTFKRIRRTFEVLTQEEFDTLKDTPDDEL